MDSQRTVVLKGRTIKGVHYIWSTPTKEVADAS